MQIGYLATRPTVSPSWGVPRTPAGATYSSGAPVASQHGDKTLPFLFSGQSVYLCSLSISLVVNDVDTVWNGGLLSGSRVLANTYSAFRNVTIFSSPRYDILFFFICNLLCRYMDHCSTIN